MFPRYKKFLWVFKRPDGWEDRGEAEGVSTSIICITCRGAVHVIRNDGEQTRLACLRCLCFIKVTN